MGGSYVEEHGASPDLMLAQSYRVEEKTNDRQGMGPTHAARSLEDRLSSRGAPGAM